MKMQNICRNSESLTKIEQLSYFKFYSNAGAQPALHFGGGNFHEISFDDVIVPIQPWYNFFAKRHR